MYSDNPVRVYRIERTVTDFPRVKLERHAMADADRFCMKVRMRNITINGDGQLMFWIDRGDVNNLHLDCANSLLDDDIETGRIDLESGVEQTPVVGS